MAKKLNNKHNLEGRYNWKNKKQQRNKEKGAQVWLTTNNGVTFYPERIK